MNPQDLRWIEALTNASFLWGPFFFSILFMLVITRTARGYYRQVSERKDPPATAEEKWDYRIYFHLSVACGIILVFVSVGWWMYAQLQQHAFQGVILGLEPNQQIVAADDDLYYRAVHRDLGNGHVVRDYHFAIVRRAPFSKGQAFRLAFYPEIGSIGEKPKAIDLVVQYKGDPNGRFKLTRDGTEFRLVAIGG